MADRKPYTDLGRIPRGNTDQDYTATQESPVVPVTFNLRDVIKWEEHGTGTTVTLVSGSVNITDSYDKFTKAMEVWQYGK